jgi:hypothetical protein
LRYSVATVDIGENELLKERFNFQRDSLGIVYFSKGFMFAHPNPTRGFESVDSLLEWAKTGWKDISNVQVPVEPKLLDKLLSYPKKLRAELSIVLGSDAAAGGLLAMICLVAAFGLAAVNGAMNRKHRAEQKAKRS